MVVLGPLFTWAAWCAPEAFPTAEVAMRYYKTAIRPALARLMVHASRQVDVTVVHWKLA